MKVINYLGKCRTMIVTPYELLLDRLCTEIQNILSIATTHQLIPLQLFHIPSALQELSLCRTTTLSLLKMVAGKYILFKWGSNCGNDCQLCGIRPISIIGKRSKTRISDFSKHAQIIGYETSWVWEETFSEALKLYFSLVIIHFWRRFMYSSIPGVQLLKNCGLSADKILKTWFD